MKKQSFFPLMPVLLMCLILLACKDPAGQGYSYGRISVSVSVAADTTAQTALSAMVFDRYVYTFTKVGETAGAKLTPDSGGFFTLKVGSYTVEVQAFAVNKGSYIPAASGVSAEFAVGAGDNEPVAVLLSAAAKDSADDDFPAVTQPITRTVTIDMYALYADGWRGYALRITVNGIEMANNIKVSTIASENKPAGQRTTNTYTFPGTTGDVVEFYWVGRSLQDDCSFIVYYADTPPIPKFDAGNNSNWNGTNALLYGLRGKMTAISDGTLLGSFTVE